MGNAGFIKPYINPKHLRGIMVSLFLSMGNLRVYIIIFRNPEDLDQCKRTLQRRCWGHGPGLHAVPLQGLHLWGSSLKKLGVPF